jgi:hypothetical protein
VEEKNPLIPLKIETGGILKLSPQLLKEMRAPVGTQFYLLPLGGGILALFRERGEKRWLEYLERCALLGRIGSLSLADLLGTLSMAQKDGVLLFQSGEIWKEIFFRKGEVVFARTNDPQYRLGAILVKRGVLSQGTLGQLLEEQERSGGRLGGLLVKKGILTSPALFDIVRYQVEEIVYSIFTLEGGLFAFFEGIEPEPDLEQFSFNTQNILMEGYRRYDEWGVIREKIPHEDVILVRKVAELPGKPETPAEPLVFRLIDGKRTVRNIVRESGLGEFDIYRALFDLIRKQAIDVADLGVQRQRKLSLEEIIESYNRLFLGLFRLLQRFEETRVVSQESLREFTETLDQRLRAVLKGITLDPSKGIDPEALLKNLEGLKGEIQKAGGVMAGYLDLFLRQQLFLALDEFLNYLLFSIKNLLPPKHADPLIEKVRSAQKEIRQRA